jgi:hypothetical protein
MVKIKIDKSKPIPEGSGLGRERKYPFDEMSVGDSFLYKEENYGQSVSSKILSSAIQYSKNKGKKFLTRKEETDEGIYTRVWRVK